MVIVLLPRSLRFCARGETESVPSRRRRQSSSTLNLEPNEGKGALSNRHSWFIRRRTRTNERQTPSARRSIPSLPRIALSHLAHRLSRHRVAPNPSLRSSFAPEGRRRPIHVSDDPPKRRSSAFHARRSAVPKSGDSDTYTEPNRTVRFASTRPTGVSHCRAVQPYPSTRTRTRSSQAPVRNRPRNRIHVTWTTSDSRRLMDSTTTRTNERNFTTVLFFFTGHDPSISPSSPPVHCPASCDRIRCVVRTDGKKRDPSKRAAGATSRVESDSESDSGLELDSTGRP